MKELIGIGIWLTWVVFMVLKLTGLVDMPWLVVWAPLWVPTLLALFGSALALVWVLGGIALRHLR